jgi:chromosome segregation ATPase
MKINLLISHQKDQIIELSHRNQNDLSNKNVENMQLQTENSELKFQIKQLINEKTSLVAEKSRTEKQILDLEAKIHSQENNGSSQIQQLKIQISNFRIPCNQENMSISKVTSLLCDFPCFAFPS